MTSSGKYDVEYKNVILSEIDGKDINETIVLLDLRTLEKIKEELGLDFIPSEVMKIYNRIYSNKDEILSYPLLIEVLGIKADESDKKSREELFFWLNDNTKMDRGLLSQGSKCIEGLSCMLVLDREESDEALLNLKETIESNSDDILGNVPIKGLDTHDGSVKKSGYRSLVGKKEPSSLQKERINKLVHKVVHLESSEKDEKELIKYMEGGWYWPKWLGPRITSVVELDAHGKATFEYPVLTKKDAFTHPREKVQELCHALRLKIISGLEGPITRSIKDTDVIRHFRSVWPGRDIESWDWWDYLYALIVKAHTEDFEKPVSEVIDRLEKTIRRNGYVQTYQGSLVNGGNIDAANNVLLALDKELESKEDIPMEKAVRKWLLGKHCVGKDAKTEIWIFGGGGLADALRVKLESKKDLTWKMVKEEVRAFAKMQESTHRALAEAGSIKNIIEDVLKDEKRKLKAKEAKEKADSDGKKKAINQLGSKKVKPPFCKICGNKGDHWAFDSEAIKIICPKYTKDPGSYDKAKAEADLASWKKIVQGYKEQNAAKAGAGEGLGRPHPKN